jgi:hypothetical protein
MPVPHDGTATTVASTGTYDVARFGIEGRSVREGSRSCQPQNGDRRVTGRQNALALVCRTHYSAEFMPSTVANAGAVRTPIISFAIFAAYTRS